MSISCLNCNHLNHANALYCNECGVPLPRYISKNNLSSSTKFSDRPSFSLEDVEDRIMSFIDKEEIDFETSGESINPHAPVPISLATRLELPERKGKEQIFSYDLAQPKVLQAALIDSATGLKFGIPSEEKSVYIGRFNMELPVQIDLSNLQNADVISRIHAVIYNDEESYFIEDAGSTNGTWLNGEKLLSGARFRKKLKSGDRIGFGRNQSIKLIFELK